MICKERLLKVLRAPYASEKASFMMENKNTIVLEVSKNTNKSEIKISLETLFGVQIKAINTVIVKGKIKRYKKNIGRRNDWKKAYVILKEGQNLDFATSYR